jgi:hypothetical protein
MNDDGGDIMSKGKMKMFTCPACGWNVKTPWGENDIIDHAMLHSKNHHTEMLNTPKSELMKLIKDA